MRDHNLEIKKIGLLLSLNLLLNNLSLPWIFSSTLGMLTQSAKLMKLFLKTFHKRITKNKYNI